MANHNNSLRIGRCRDLDRLGKSSPANKGAVAIKDVKRDRCS